MNAFDLLTTLAARRAIPATRVKDFRTSVQKLAAAVHTPVEDLDLVALAPTYEATLKTYFAELSPPASVHTQRNTLANLRQLYRALAAQRLLPRTAPVSPRLSRKALVHDAFKASPYRPRSRAVLSAYYLPLADWPPAIRDGWERFRTARAFDLRPATLELHWRFFRPYVSFGVGIDRPPMATWDDVFDTARLTRFITWHAKRVGEPRISQTGRQAAIYTTLIAKYDQRPEHAQLRALANRLPVPVPTHNKQSPLHTISAHELEGVGLALLAEAQRPVSDGAWHFRRCVSPLARRAVWHQIALMIRLMWRLPLRNRAIREMELGKNLYQDTEGMWRLRYVGEELKVSQRRGQVNRLDLPWPPELVDHLEEYLRDFRPHIPHAASRSHVFLTTAGTPLSSQRVHRRLADEVCIRLGKRLYPHLLRTLWVDQYLLASNGDVSTAAYMLNDDVNTVLKRYHELRGADHVAKAYAFNQAVLKKGK